MKNIKKIEVKGSYLMPEERAWVGTVDQAIIEKVNEIIEVINKPVETTNEQPKVYKAVRRLEDVGEFTSDRGGFFELIVLYNEEGKVVAKSLCTHPESHFSFTYRGVEYYSLPHSRGTKPVYSRLVV